MLKDKKIVSKIFIIALAIAGILIFASPTKEISYEERRPLSTWPEFTWENLVSGDYFSDLSSALADQMPYRTELLGLKARLQKSIQKKDNSRVYFADDGHLVMMNTELAEANLDRNIEDMLSFYNEKFKQSEDAKEASLLLAPTISGVAPEILPKYNPDVEQEPIINRALALTKDSDFIAPQLLEALKTAKTNVDAVSDLYFKTDHHWTQTGAKVAFEEFLKDSNLEKQADIKYEKELVSSKFYGTNWAKASTKAIAPDKVYAYENEALDEVKLYDQNGELIRTGYYNEEAKDSYDPYEYFIGENRDYLRLETNSHTGRNLLLFKDSYANAFTAFLTPYYDNITIIDLRYFADNIDDVLAQEDFTDLMFLYNLETLAGDNNIYKLIK